MAKTILFLGAGIEQTIAIKLAQEMKLKVIAIDGNPKAPGLKIANVGINADIKDVKAIIRIGKNYEIDGVMSHAVEIPQVVAKVAKALNLPGLDPKVAERATNKLKRIRCLTKYKIPCPRFEIAKTIREAEKKAKKIGFPCVIKPIDNAGARGAQKVNKIEEIRRTFREALANSKKKTILIEEFLQGKEISTESVIYQDKIITTGFGDRNYSRNEEFKPYFVEDGHNVPSSISKKKKKKILRTINSAIRALGINWGVAKGDVLLENNNRVNILEMAVRTSGGWFCAGTVPIATGVNILKPLIKMSVGEPVKESELKARYNRAACQRYIIPVEEGIFEKIDGLRRVKKMPSVKMLTIFNSPKKGELIKKATNHSERYGQLIAEGKDVNDAIIKCENAMKLIKIIVRK